MTKSKMIFNESRYCIRLVGDNTENLISENKLELINKVFKFAFDELKIEDNFLYVTVITSILCDEDENGEPVQLYGLYHSGIQHIAISGSCLYQDLILTIIHEMLHYYQELNNLYMDEDITEEQTEILYQKFKINDQY